MEAPISVKPRYLSGISLRACRAAAYAALAAALSFAAFAQDQNTTVKDEIFARKIMMDTIDEHMDAIDWMLTSGAPLDLSKTSDHADTISVLLMAFPHLFPPGTNQWRAGGASNPARDTFAAPEIWKNYSDFYRLAAEASKLAFAASKAKQESEFRKTMAALRVACDGCHARYVKGAD